jgi:hypothetical protein
MAYILPPGCRETTSAFKKRMYGILYAVDIVAKGAPNMWIIRKCPLTPWKQVWQNLHNAWISDSLKSICYTAINELTPTNERLAPLRLAEMDRCYQSGRTDMQQHRILEFGTENNLDVDGMIIASSLQCNSRKVSEEWVVRPCFRFWPLQKHATRPFSGLLTATA